MFIINLMTLFFFLLNICGALYIESVSTQSGVTQLCIYPEAHGYTVVVPHYMLVCQSSLHPETLQDLLGDERVVIKPSTLYKMEYSDRPSLNPRRETPRIIPLRCLLPYATVLLPLRSADMVYHLRPLQVGESLSPHTKVPKCVNIHFNRESLSRLNRTDDTYQLTFSAEGSHQKPIDYIFLGISILFAVGFLAYVI